MKLLLLFIAPVLAIAGLCAAFVAVFALSEVSANPQEPTGIIFFTLLCLVAGICFYGSVKSYAKSRP